MAGTSHTKTANYGLFDSGPTSFEVGDGFTSNDFDLNMLTLDLALAFLQTQVNQLQITSINGGSF